MLQMRHGEGAFIILFSLSVYLQMGSRRNPLHKDSLPPLRGPGWLGPDRQGCASGSLRTRSRRCLISFPNKQDAIEVEDWVWRQAHAHHGIAVLTTPMTMTMTMTHSKKFIQQSLVAWPYRRERRGHDPTKSLLKLVWLALWARFALTHC